MNDRQSVVSRVESILRNSEPGDFSTVEIDIGPVRTRDMSKVAERVVTACEEDYKAIVGECVWTLAMPDAEFSWYESDCGLNGNPPYESWKFCPECGRKVVVEGE